MNGPVPITRDGSISVCRSSFAETSSGWLNRLNSFASPCTYVASGSDRFSVTLPSFWSIVSRPPQYALRPKSPVSVPSASVLFRCRSMFQTMSSVVSARPAAAAGLLAPGP